MVISYVRRFLFVHVYKAAGMSIEAALRAYDVRSALHGYPPEEQRRLLGEVGFNPAILDMQRHVFARELRDTLGLEAFARLFKFAFVRNPWDLQLSLYHFNLAHPEFPAHARAAGAGSFEAYIMGMAAKRHPVGQQRQFLVDGDGKPLVDFIGRFENLVSDFARVCDRLGLAHLSLDHINKSQHDPWPTRYSRAMFDRVREIHRPDIEYFGYADDAVAYGVA